MNENKALIVFQDKRIRRIWHNNEWYFSVIDVINALGASTIPKRYWSDLKSNLANEGFQPYDFIVQLKLSAEDGKLRLTDCANTKSMFRIVQSIPSKKAEPFKQWLAKVGYERVEEIQDPELAQKRMIETYRAKGYSEEWIEKRIRGIAVRDELTKEWGQRGVKQGKEFAILTSEISKATFGVTPKEHKEFKQLKRENLRDHMDDLELIFTMLGEASTTEIAKSKDVQGLDQNKDAAQKGGDIAGGARKQLEKETGKKVLTNDNYLKTPEKVKRLEKD